MKKMTLLLGAVAALALAACSGHGAGAGIPCVQTMPGMNMCDQTAPVVPATAQAPQK
ncbi:MAG TPA: hypothetical protein VN848_13065 [Gemmatimonadales bacterium]|nr:hypothetical protein [Gemmatimonadales bacterium]